MESVLRQHEADAILIKEGGQKCWVFHQLFIVRVIVS